MHVGQDGVGGEALERLLTIRVLLPGLWKQPAEGKDVKLLGIEHEDQVKGGEGMLCRRAFDPQAQETVSSE